jgi:hypothetical protein
MFTTLKTTRRRRSRRPAQHRPSRLKGRLYVARPGGHIFLSRGTQHLRRRLRVAGWLGAGAMLAGVGSWGLLLSLLGS